jgi:hypothetical protein
MNWSLLLSDTLARLVGLLGLIACAFWSLVLARRFTGVAAEGTAVFPSAMFALATFFTLVFLLPNTHDRVMRLTFPVFARLLFLPVAIAGLGAVAFGVMGFTAISPLEQDVYAIVVTSATMSLGALFAILIFPVGLAYREAKLEHRHAQHIRHMQAIRDHEALLARSGSSASRHPVLPNGLVLRKSDTIDNLTGLPGLFVFAAVFYGFKISTTVQTAELDQWADRNWLLGSAVCAALVFGPSFLNVMMRGAPYNPRAMNSKWGRRILTAALVPPVSFVAFVGLAYDGVPATWNLIHDAPPATIRYEITDISTGRRTRGCMTLQLAEDPARQMYVCNLPDSLQVGDVIDATGPLSAYGHSIEQVNLVR